MSFEKEMSDLIEEQIFFAERVYFHLPIGMEIYDANGVLRKINNQAKNMYGVDDINMVIDKINLFDSPYMDEELEKKIKSGEDIVLEFEYDFDRVNKEYFATHNQNSMIYEVKVVSIKNKKDIIVGYMLLTNDVTNTKEAEYRTEESKRNLEMAMEAANMSSWVYDVYKKEFGSLHGEAIVKEYMTMEELQKMLHPQDRVSLSEIFTRLINKEIEQGCITVRVFNEQEMQYRYYESRMRLSDEHRGKLLIVGTQLDVTEKIQMAKNTKDLINKRALAMKVSNIVHWDFDVRTQKFESYNDPVNDYAFDKLLTIEEYLAVIHSEDRSFAFDGIQSMLSGKDLKVDFSCRIQTKYDHSWQYCNIIGVPFEYNDEGEVIRFTGFRQNISKLHNLNEELRERNYKMELTFKTVGMSYWDFDVESVQFRAFNDPVNDFHPDKPILPEDYLNAAHPDDTDAVRDNIECMTQGKIKDFSFQYRSRTKWNQDWQTLIITGIPVERNKKGQIIRYTGIAFNNTKWEKMAQELKDLKEKAELSDRLKSAFLANMSHEIRTPLNAIVGFSELMVNCDNQAEKDEYMSIIESNNELLLRLINDILDLSKIESGILERKRERFDLSKVCNELYTMILPKITNPNVRVEVNDNYSDCWVFLDRSRLKQVWMNYLINAVKCTHSGYIKLGYWEEDNGIRIFVEDSGTGIPDELQERVFGRFQKLNDFAQGTGLGLAITKAIVEAAGGKVGFTSTFGVGSTFWAWLPCEVKFTNNIENSETKNLRKDSFFTDTAPKNLKILVAEDNESNYLLVKRILKDYDLTHVVNGIEAIRKVLDEKFDLVIMDLKMPIMGGLEATRKIREFNPRIPIVALTANAFESDRVDAMEAGCNAFLTKPVKKEQLLELFS
ncbi:PAS domain-containing hybrid sensor histidine kinase/response regulator [Coprobacter tertius]|uniref:histidine kinase n=1 Tax=Coprobacter tertius TaxID=2944915 RepID=A0ABT1MEY4_9BACT|nr:response regulator [Coprobacter tertius]MCP9611192.1 response regulator [Coprobacter tertius]